MYIILYIVASVKKNTFALEPSRVALYICMYTAIYYIRQQQQPRQQQRNYNESG